jgi:hypothetical protein
MVMQRTALVFEHEKKFAAVFVLAVVDDPILDFTDAVEVMQAEVWREHLAGRHYQPPLLEHARRHRQRLLALRPLQLKVQHPLCVRPFHPFTSECLSTNLRESTRIVSWYLRKFADRI